MIHNQRYFSHEVVMNRIARKFPSIEIDENDILEWCQHVEVDYIQDMHTMAQYVGIPITIISSKVILPCNIFKIRSVYDNNSQPVTYSHQGVFLNGIRNYGDSILEDDTVIYINYVGTPIDTATGIPLIARGHEAVCETYCKINLFEEQVALGKFDRNMWLMWKEQFSGQITNAKSSYRAWTEDEMNVLQIIRSNMVPKAFTTTPSHKIAANINKTPAVRASEES